MPKRLTRADIERIREGIKAWNSGGQANHTAPATVRMKLSCGHEENVPPLLDVWPVPGQEHAQYAGLTSLATLITWGMEKESDDIPEPLRAVLIPIIERFKTEGWKISVKRPKYSNHPERRISVEVTSADGTAHALTRFDEDNSLPNKIESLIRSLSN